MAHRCKAAVVVLPVAPLAESGFLTCAKLVLSMPKTRIYLIGPDDEELERFALFAGAVRGGQVVGETDSKGERPKSRAMGPQNVLGTVYHTLGIDPSRTRPLAIPRCSSTVMNPQAFVPARSTH